MMCLSFKRFGCLLAACGSIGCQLTPPEFPAAKPDHDLRGHLKVASDYCRDAGTYARKRGTGYALTYAGYGGIIVGGAGTLVSGGMLTNTDGESETRTVSYVGLGSALVGAVGLVLLNAGESEIRQGRAAEARIREAQVVAHSSMVSAQGALRADPQHRFSPEEERQPITLMNTCAEIASDREEQLLDGRRELVTNLADTVASAKKKQAQAEKEVKEKEKEIKAVEAEKQKLMQQFLKPQ